MTTLKCPAFSINTCWEWLVCQFSTVVSVVACLTLMPVLVLCWCGVFFYLFIHLFIYGQHVISKVMINAFPILLLQIRIALKSSLARMQTWNEVSNVWRIWVQMHVPLCTSFNPELQWLCACVWLCRECQGEAHEPCDCQTWKMWLQKVSDMKPEECKYGFAAHLYNKCIRGTNQC